MYYRGIVYDVLLSDMPGDNRWVLVGIKEIPPEYYLKGSYTGMHINNKE